MAFLSAKLAPLRGYSCVRESRDLSEMVARSSTFVAVLNSTDDSIGGGRG